MRGVMTHFWSPLTLGMGKGEGKGKRGENSDDQQLFFSSLRFWRNTSIADLEEGETKILKQGFFFYFLFFSSSYCFPPLRPSRT